MINSKEALLKFIAYNAGLNIDIKEETELKEDLDFDDLDLIELMMALEEEFNVDIPDEDSTKFVTIQDIITYLQTKNIILN